MRRIGIMAMAMLFVFLAGVYAERVWFSHAKPPHAEVAQPNTPEQPPTNPPVQEHERRFYHTAGLCGEQQVPLPHDYPLDVLTAVAMLHGPLMDGSLTVLAADGVSVVADPTIVCELIRSVDAGNTKTIRVDFADPLSSKSLVHPGDTIRLRRLVD